MRSLEPLRFFTWSAQLRFSEVRVWLAPPLALVVACSAGSADSPDQSLPRDSIPAGRELIPAEWTIAEDTSETGEITTVSLQLPTAREIAGLVDDEAPRLVLRCLGGRVEAFIDPLASAAGDDADTSAVPEPVPIQLDSAPVCE